jgi:large subunit ribosomal protein L22
MVVRCKGNWKREKKLNKIPNPNCLGFGAWNLVLLLRSKSIMEVTAKLNYLRIAPRKVRLVADLIRGKRVEEAQRILNFTRKKAAQPLRKLLNSAIANAKHNFQLKAENLWISKLLVNEGPKLKRWRARARGRAFEIQKKTSHITIVLKELESEKRPIKKKPVKEEKSKVVKEQAPKIKAEKEVPERKEKIKRPPRPIEREVRKPKFPTGIKRIFRRKSFG